jgi:hypothetical protein
VLGRKKIEDEFQGIMPMTEETKMSKPEAVSTANFAELFDQRIAEVLVSEDNRRLVGELAYSNFKKYGGCAQSIMQAFMDVLGLRDDFLFQAFGGLHGGGRSGFTCGALNAGFMLFSLILGRNKLEYKSTVCSEITGYDWFGLADLVTQHPSPTEKDRRENCARLTGGTAYKIAEILNEISLLHR